MAGGACSLQRSWIFLSVWALQGRTSPCSWTSLSPWEPAPESWPCHFCAWATCARALGCEGVSLQLAAGPQQELGERLECYGGLLLVCGRALAPAPCDCPQIGTAASQSAQSATKLRPAPSFVPRPSTPLPPPAGPLSPLALHSGLPPTPGPTSLVLSPLELPPAFLCPPAQRLAAALLPVWNRRADLGSSFFLQDREEIW